MARYAWSLCVHEAGHAVIGRALGLVCGSATVIADYDDMSAGHAIVHDHWVAQEFWAARGRHREASTAVLAGILSLMAGAEAEREIVHRCRGGDGDDRTWISIRMDSSDASQRCTDESRLRKIARQLVRRHRDGIESVALELKLRGTLSPEQINDLIPRSLAPVLTAPFDPTWIGNAGI